MIAAPYGVAPIQRQLEGVHATLQEKLPFVRRIAVALYDRPSNGVAGFVHSSDGAVPRVSYEACLNDVPSLAQLAEHPLGRVIDLTRFSKSPSPHMRALVECGYRSSYALPFYDNGELFGFVFFDSDVAGYFSEAVIRHLSIHAQLVGLIVVNALAPATVLRSAVSYARKLSRFRDRETGAHLDRMARYARIIGKAVAPLENRDSEFVEFVFLFAPLHDVGKIAIPDRILLKPSRLNASERTIMETHVSKGVEVVDEMAASFGIGPTHHLSILRNIVAYHHELFDGTGYLVGLAGRNIPLEARIVNVADVFDALTTPRPYKSSWSNADAYDFLYRHSGGKFDPICTEALLDQRKAVKDIQARFCRSDDQFFQNNHDTCLETFDDFAAESAETAPVNDRQ